MLSYKTKCKNRFNYKSSNQCSGKLNKKSSNKNKKYLNQKHLKTKFNLSLPKVIIRPWMDLEAIKLSK